MSGDVTIETVATTDQLERCFAIRFAVFVDEQRVPPEEEMDALDRADTTIHLLASVDGEDLGTLRVLGEGAGHCHIGRVAVHSRARGTGMGRLLMERAGEVALERCADDQGHLRIELSAQEQAMGFYQACGYSPVSGERYLDAGIWHQDMALELTRK
ncbi:MAG: GNAT family N-acetyltransferase [Ancrocorticia sp.]|uniref:GNAT family N-acetyltransferase n=1 Tax=Ancrocorticia sp. TaxID=2593684 RepID=UPI003F913CCA